MRVHSKNKRNVPIDIIGYGSLVDEGSAAKTVPNLKNFDLYWLNGYRRIFDKVNTFCMQDNANLGNDKDLAAATVVRDPNAAPMIVCAFTIEEEKSWEDIQKRECDYMQNIVDVEGYYEEEDKRCGLIFESYQEEALMLGDLGPRHEIYDHYPEFLKAYDGPSYRGDILPSRAYLTRCMKAYLSHGRKELDNFIETSYLADGKTPLIQQLQKWGWDIAMPDSWE